MNARVAEQQRRSVLFASVVEVLGMHLRSAGVADDVADHAAHAAADGLADEWGGQVISIPTEHAYRLAKREREILDRRAAGASVHELARQYGMTEKGVYRLIRRAELRTAGERQQDLFGGPTPPAAQNAQEAP